MQLFSVDLMGNDLGYAGHISTRFGKAGNQTAADGIADLEDHDRNDARSLFGGNCRRSAVGDDNIHVQPKELRDYCWDTLIPSVEIVVRDGRRVSFDVAELAQSLPERLNAASSRRLGKGRDETDPRKLPRLLPLDGERHDKRQDDEEHECSGAHPHRRLPEDGW